MSNILGTVGLVSPVLSHHAQLPRQISGNSKNKIGRLRQEDLLSLEVEEHPGQYSQTPVFKIERVVVVLYPRSPGTWGEASLGCMRTSVRKPHHGL